jgi:hypothetical protein
VQKLLSRGTILNDEMFESPTGLYLLASFIAFLSFQYTDSGITVFCNISSTVYYL